MPDLFVSYSHRDKQQVARVVEALIAAGLTVWWDDLIVEGRWSGQIEAALQDCTRVVVFMTPNVMASENHSVFVEAQRAKRANKLIPVKIGDFALSYEFESMVIGLQMLLAADFQGFITGEGLRRVRRLFSHETGARPTIAAESPSLDFGGDTQLLSLAAAVAVAEHAPVSVVTGLAQDLGRRLDAADGRDPKTDGVPTFMRRRGDQYARIGASTVQVPSRRYNVDMTLVRFDDPNRAHGLFKELWLEYDGLRTILVGWLNEAIAAGPPDVQRRIALRVGGLALDDFVSIWSDLLRQWVAHRDPAFRDVADRSLSVAVIDGRLGVAVGDLIRDLARSEELSDRIGAVEIACGYTGSRIKGLSIEVLKLVGRSAGNNGEIVAAMRRSIDFMLRESEETEDGSLFDWRRLINELADWATSVDRTRRDQLPMMLFLDLMERLPLVQRRGVLGAPSVAAIVAEDAGLRSQEVLTSAARVFDAALRDLGDEDFSPRSKAESVLRHWMSRAGPSDTETKNAPLLAFVRAIFAQCRSDRDRDRLSFIVRSTFPRMFLAQPLLDLNTTDGSP